MNSKQKLRVGLVGANWGVVGHLPVWRALQDRIEIVAICTSRDETARRAAEAHGFPLYFSDHRKMLAEAKLDIVDIGTKPSSRQLMVLDALEAGIHVLSYNPFAVDNETARAQFSLQQKQGVVAGVEAQMQWLPQFIYMRELIESGFLGDFHHVNVNCHFGLKAIGEATFPAIARPTGYPTNAGYNWLGQAESGASVVRNIAGQCLHGLVALFGEVAEVVSHVSTELKTWTFPDGEEFYPDTCDTASAILRFRNGGSAQLNVGWAVPHARAFSFEAWGSEGRMRAEAPGGFPDTPTLKLFTARMDRQGKNAPLRPLWANDEELVNLPSRLLHPPGSELATADGGRYRLAMYYLFKDMLDAIRDGREARPSFAQALHVHYVCDAIEHSSKTRQWEPIPQTTAGTLKN